MDDSNISGNQSDFFGQKVSIPGINVNSAGDNQLILKDNYSTRLYYNAQGVATVLLGKRTSTTPSQQGLFVSKSGIDVTQANDSQLIFNSSQDIFKIVAKGSINIPAFTTGTGGINYSAISVPHNQLFTPIVNVFARGSILDSSLSLVASSYIPLPIYISGGTGRGGIIGSYYFLSIGGTFYSCSIVFAVDATNIYFEAACNTSTGSADTILSIPISYYIMQETAN